MKEKWLLLKNRFEAFEKRERLLIIGAIVAVVYLLWDFIFFQPMAKDMQLFTARERVARQTIQTSRAEIQVLSGLVRTDPNIALHQEIADLREKLTILDRELANAAIGLVPAQALPKVMHSVLSNTGKLRMINMTTLPPEQIALPSEPGSLPATADGATNNSVTEAADGSTTNDSGVKLFKHAVILNLEGDFPAVVQYLKDLEESDWRFYWESLRYEVKRYPIAQVRLRVFTLSSQRGVLDGV